MAASSEPTLPDIRRWVCESAASTFEYYDFQPVSAVARMTSDCERLSIFSPGDLGSRRIFHHDGVVITHVGHGVASVLLILTTIPALILISLYFQKRI